MTEPEKSQSNAVAIVLAILLGVAFVGIMVSQNSGGGGGRWPAAAEQAGFNSCKARGGSATQCVCVLNALEAHYSYGEIAYASGVLNNTGSLPASVVSVLANSGC